VSVTSLPTSTCVLTRWKLSYELQRSTFWMLPFSICTQSSQIFRFNHNIRPFVATEFCNSFILPFLILFVTGFMSLPFPPYCSQFPQNHARCSPPPRLKGVHPPFLNVIMSIRSPILNFLPVVLSVLVIQYIPTDTLVLSFILSKCSCPFFPVRFPSSKREIIPD